MVASGDSTAEIDSDSRVPSTSRSLASASTSVLVSSGLGLAVSSTATGGFFALGSGTTEMVDREGSKSPLLMP